MTPEFENLHRLIDALLNDIERKPPEVKDHAKHLCEYSRLLHMRCALAVFNEDRTWDLETAEKAERALRETNRVCAGTVYEKNIAERTRAVSEMKKRSFTWRARKNLDRR